MTEENKPETLDKKVVRMFLAGELRNVSCLTDDLDNASCPIEIDNPASRRLVTLAADCEFVPIRRIGDLICDALTAQEAFNFGFRHDCWRRPKTEPLLRVVPTQN